MTSLKTQPNNLEEAVNWLLSHMDSESEEFLKTSTEKEFLAVTHHGFGTSLRNAWGLWKNSTMDRDTDPKDEPEIVKWFWKTYKIYHSDDMSGIILTTVYRRYHKKEERIQEQVDKYLKHWENLKRTKNNKDDEILDFPLPE